MPFDNRLVESAGSVYDLENAGNSFSVQIPTNTATSAVKISEAGQWVKLRLHGAGEQPPTSEGNVATFGQVSNADSVQYEVVDSGIKESIVLEEQPSDPPSFRYTIDASDDLEPVIQPNGAVWFVERRAAGDYATGVPFAIPPGVMYDSAQEPAASSAVKYELDVVGDAWQLRVVPDPNWLTDPARIYPVVVDPSITNQPTSRDCWISQKNPETHYCNSPDYVRSGVGAEGYLSRGLFRFDVAAIPANATITAATAYLHMDASRSTTNNLANYAFRSPKYEWKSPSYPTWRTSGTAAWTGGCTCGPAFGTKALSGDNTGWKNFTGLGALVQQWVSRPENNRGMLLKQEGETVKNVLFFRSSTPDGVNDGLRPYMNINYTVPQVTTPAMTLDPCLDACEEWYAASLTPTFTAKSTSSTNSTIQYSWSIQDANSGDELGTATTSAASGQPSRWTVPSGLLDQLQVYSVRVSASTATGSATSPWSQFTTDLGWTDATGAGTDPEPDPSDGEEFLEDLSEYDSMPTTYDPGTVVSTESAVPLGLEGTLARTITARPAQDSDPGPNIPFAGWAACGARDDKFKVVHDYRRTGWHPRMERTYARLYCGIYEKEECCNLFGYRHVKDAHSEQFQDWAWLINRNWRDLTGWMLEWTLKDPDKATVPSSTRFCYQRRFFFVMSDDYTKRVRVAIRLGKTGVRIMTIYPTNASGAGPCKGEESPYTVDNPDAS